MNEKLQAELADLQQHLDKVNNAVPLDVVEKNRIEASIAAKKQEIADQAQRQQQIEEKVQGDGITFSVPGVDFTNLPAEMIKLIQVVVQADRRRVYNEEGAKQDQLAAKHKDELKAANDQVAQHQQQVDTLQQVNASLQHQIADLTQENQRVGAIVSQDESTIQDLNQKLANAAAQLDEAHKEIERLNSQVDEYQKAKVFGERQAQKVIDVTPEETSAIQDLVNKIVAVNPINGNWHEVVKEDGSKMVVHQSDLPNLQTETGSPFRGDTQTQPNGHQLPSAETAANVGGTFPVFITPEVPTVSVEHGSGTPNQTGTGSAGQDAPVTRQEHEELKQRVAALEAARQHVA